ncbi:hypothetical protein DL1_20120 [Thioclava dalianensis]|uniref:Zinc-ribbon domain-containing protein n=1 Tax=Thioclava dalianensis TaxID=1185766 RepID=A0A074TEI2_9RHOB|nr:putative zinc-binding metallopeptidase [Thioclava dalianensis]KEP70089.1 hypothetical protein DL1_20120 [Thioclava dalianensis]SFN51554.1 hypothetical protein SAMN05216224_106148 [Thioclava dalianensis]
MQRFQCPACASEIWFHNTNCLHCGTGLIWKSERAAFVRRDASTPPCANRSVIHCNWQAAPGETLCSACRHTTVVPDLSVPGNDVKWARIETDKRALLALLSDLGLPLVDADGAPSPRFEFRADPADPSRPRVLTGHANGVITLNIAEADDAERERIRTQMGEPYRSLPGHLRHEVAHHFWQVLVQSDPARLETIRAVFGDDRADYAASLQNHYKNGPPQNWTASYVSAYASAHPWEDFAESWAHVLHLLDGLETASAYSLLGPSGLPGDVANLVGVPMRRLSGPWIHLSIALNAVNAAMGHASFYPFVLSPDVLGKLDTIRALIASARGEAAEGAH